MSINLNGNAQEVKEDQKEGSNDYQFDIFLSYSRKDEEFARKLEEALKDYRLPKDVKTRLISKNRLRVFRDKHDLVPTDGDYWKTIEGYSKKSANLVLICSPYARQSPYVNHEIKGFLQSHESKAIIPLLLSGKPNNEIEAGQDEYAFPDALSDVFSMPLAVDFTEFQRARGKVNKGHYQDPWYTLLAKIFGAERAEIERQDAKRQARNRAIFAAVTLAIIALLSVALFFTVISRQEAASQRDHAQNLLYASDMSLAQNAFKTNNIKLGSESLRFYLTSDPSSQKDQRGFEWYYLWQLYNDHIAVFDGTEDIAFARKGEVFATATDGTLKIWETASLPKKVSIKPSRPESATNDPSNKVYWIDISPDGKTLAYSDDKGVMLLDVDYGASREVTVRKKRLVPMEVKDPLENREAGFLESVEGRIPRFSPDGRLLAISYTCGIVTVYDAHSLAEIARLGDGPPASYCESFVTFSPNGRFLAYGDSYNVRLWDTVTHSDLGGPEMDNSLPDGVDQVVVATFSPDGKILAIGDRSKQVVLWNIATKKVLARLEGHEGWVSALAFALNGKTLYSGSNDTTVKLWDFSSYNGDGKISGEKIKAFATIKGHTDSIISIKCSPDGKFISTVGSEGTAKLWSETGGRDFDVVENVEAVSQEANILAKYTDGEKTTLFNFSAGELSKFWTVNELNPLLSPDGKKLATSSYAGPIKLWDLSSKRQLLTLQEQSIGELYKFSPDSKQFTALSSDGKSLILWDLAKENKLIPIKNDIVLENYLFSPNGKVIVTVDKGGQRMQSWDASSRKQLAVYERTPINEFGMREKEEGVKEDLSMLLALSPDGKLLAFSDSEEVNLWETGSTQQEPILLGKHEMSIRALVFSPDGKLLSTGDESGVVKVWETTERKELSTFQGHKNAVTVLAFSQDGRTLASGGDDGTVKLYGKASMRELITLTHESSPTSETHALQGSEDSIQELLFSADGKSLITLSGNGVLRRWHGADDANIFVRDGQNPAKKEDL